MGGSLRRYDQRQKESGVNGNGKIPLNTDMWISTPTTSLTMH